MALINPESPLTDPSVPAPDEGALRSAPAGLAPLPPPAMGRILAAAAIAAIVAGMASTLVGEVIMERYRGDLNPSLKAHLDIKDMQRWNDARVHSAIWTFATMGGILGLAMGLAGGLARRSAMASAPAALAGLLLGAAVSSALSAVLVRWFYNVYDEQSVELTLPLLTHGAIGSAVGAIGGLAFGLGLGGSRRWKATILGGLLGAAAASILYEIVGAVAFASSQTDLPVSASIVTRAMAQLLVAIFSGVGAAWALRQSSEREPASPIPS
jgi:hypothetical protein